MIIYLLFLCLPFLSQQKYTNNICENTNKMISINRISHLIKYYKSVLKFKYVDNMHEWFPKSNCYNVLQWNYIEKYVWIKTT